MSNIISIPKVSPDEPSTAVNHRDPFISNNSFFPDVSLKWVRNVMRADGLTTDDRLMEAIREAMAFVNHELAPLQAKAEKQGHSQLSQLPQDYLGDQPIFETRYLRAVSCWAMANLYERYRSFDSTKEGAEKAQEYENSVSDLRRDARFAIRDLLGTERWTVALV